MLTYGHDTHPLPVSGSDGGVARLRRFLEAQLKILAEGGMTGRSFIYCAFALLLAAGGGELAQAQQIVTAAAGNYTISGLAVFHSEAKSFRHGIALFPGQPGIMRLREEDGELKYRLRGNFLLRSMHEWLDGETLVLAVDAPSDQWASFAQHFRETPRYGADVALLLHAAGKRYGITDWTLVGTSEGSVSAFHAGRMNPGLVRRVILTASLFSPGRIGPGLAGVNWDALKAKLLWVHHEHDPCPWTSYRSARAFAGKTAAPLVTVRGGGPGRGDECQAFSAHGFVGIERETVLAMRGWVKSGEVPPDVGR